MLKIEITGDATPREAEAALVALGVLFPHLATLGASTAVERVLAAGDNGYNPDNPPPATARPALNLTGAEPVATPEEVFSPPAVPAPVASAAPIAPPPAPTPVSVTPASPASPAPAASSPAPSHGVETDKTGLPWDARIHAETKTKNADQTWRKKRGVDPNLVVTVEAELRALMGVAPAPSAAPVEQQSAPTPPPPPAAASAPPAPAPAAEAPPPPVPAAPAAPLATPPAAPAPALAPDAMQAFTAVARKVTEGMNEGKLTQEIVDWAIGETGRRHDVPLKQLRELIHRPDLVPTFDEIIDSYLAA